MSSSGLTSSLHRKNTITSTKLLISLSVLIIAIIPPLYIYFRNPFLSIFHFFAADTFVYLSVAANSQIGFYTFDGSLPTNGFHPLWQLLLQALFQIFGISAAKPLQIEVSFWLSVALVTIGGLFTAHAVLRWTDSFAIALLTFPGLFGIVPLLLGWPMGTPWHFMNGMESPASLFFFGIFLFYVSRDSNEPLVSESSVDRRRLVTLSLIFCALVFSRLDDIFLPAIFGFWLLLTPQAPIRRRIQAAVWFGIPLGFALAAYLLVNKISVGHATPVSGAAKFDALFGLNNFIFLSASLCSIVPDFLCNPINRFTNITSVNWHNAQMLAPLGIAYLFLRNIHWFHLKNRNSFETWIRILLIYVIVKSLYNFLFVHLFHQGFWYFPLSIAVINVSLAVAAARLRDRFSERYLKLNRIFLPGICLITAACILVFVNSGRVALAETSYSDFFQRGREIAEKLKESVETPKIVELDDGIVNYSLGLPTISGFLFAIDSKAYTAFNQGDFLTEASRRGYQLIGTLFYLRSFETAALTQENIPTILRKHVIQARKWDMKRFDFALEYRDEETGAAFIRFTPKPGRTP